VILPIKLSLTVDGSMIDLLFSLASGGRRRWCMVSCDMGERGNKSGSLGGEGSLCCSSNSAVDREVMADPEIFVTKGLDGERGRISAVPTDIALLKLELLVVMMITRLLNHYA